MVKDEREITQEDGTTVNELLGSENKAGTDWFTKLAEVKRAKALRRESQKARKGKPITFSRSGRWSQPGKPDA